MTYLLSEEGRRALSTLTEKPILYAFDFDGTLAPISPDRDAVKIPRSVSERLKELTKRAPCAIVSGRALADLTLRVDRAVPHLIGNHGLESPCTAPTTLIWAENVCTEWMKRVTTDFVEPLKDYGVEVENKRYTLTFHYRGADGARQCSEGARPPAQSTYAGTTPDCWKSIGECLAPGEIRERNGRLGPHASSTKDRPVFHW